MTSSRAWRSAVGLILAAARTRDVHALLIAVAMNHRRSLIAALALVVGLAVPGAIAQGKGDAAAGKVLYEKECAKCHGITGSGDGPQGPKLKPPPSNWSAGGGGLKGMDDQKIFDSIHKGGKAVGKAAVMPAYPRLSDAEVWNVVAYVKTLQK